MSSSKLSSKFITSVLEDPDGILKAQEIGFKEMFLSQGYREPYLFIQERYNKHGVPPSKERIRSRYPEISFTSTTDSASEVAEELMLYYKRAALGGAVKQTFKGLEAIQKDPTLVYTTDEIVSALLQKLNEIGDVTSAIRDVDVSEESFVELFERKYTDRQNRVGVLTWPWETAQQECGSLEKDDFIVICARPGKKKTFVLTWAAIQYSLQGKKVLFISNELNIETMMFRYAAIKAQIPYGQLRNTTLGVDDVRNRLVSSLKGGDFIISGDDAEMGAGTVGYVEAKIQKYEPDVILIDGAYLLDDDSRARDKYEKAGNVVRKLKKLAKKYAKPIFCTWQLNRSSENGEVSTKNLGLTDNLGQDASYVIAIMQTEDQSAANTLILKFVKTRNGPPIEIQCNADFTTMDFSECEDEYEDDEDVEY